MPILNPISLVVTGFLLFSQVHAVTIAVIDSGTDVKHVNFKGKIWVNLGEDPSNERDDDGNDFPNDINGWNFAENNNKLIDYKYGELYKNQDLFKFFEIQKKTFLNTITAEDKAWLESKRSDALFIKQLGVFGNFIHGTHVSGISASLAQSPEIIGIKLLPTEAGASVKEAQIAASRLGLLRSSPGDGPVTSGPRIKIIQAAMSKLAQQTAVTMGTVGRYVKAVKARVANGSFGMGPAQAEMIVKTLFKVVFFREPVKEESVPLVKFFLAEANKAQAILPNSSKSTLFVFAAGNDGSNNDVFPSAPASVGGDNVISVAATLGNESLATFSNFGQAKVDIATPGVAIESPIPLDRTMAISGTSQAAPRVASAAARIIEINPKLSPKEVKKILMETVDLRDYLVGKVKSSGSMNEIRASKAAELSLTLSLDSAISQSKTLVKPLASKLPNKLVNKKNVALLPLVPMTSLIKLN